MQPSPQNSFWIKARGDVTRRAETMMMMMMISFVDHWKVFRVRSPLWVLQVCGFSEWATRRTNKKTRRNIRKYKMIVDLLVWARERRKSFFSRCLEYKKPTHTFGLCESWVGFPRRLLWKCGFLRGCVFVRGGKVKFLLQRDQIAARQKWSFPVSSSVSVCDWRFEGKKEWQKRGNHSKNDRSIFTAPSEDRSRAGKLDKLDYEFSYLETTTTISIISSDHWSSVCERSRRKRRRRGKTHRDRDQWSSATTSSISNGCVLRICVCAYVGVERMCDDDDALWAVDSIHKWVVECEWRRKKK